MPASMRPSGLDVLGDLPWGTHVCIFYETEQDLLDTLVPYFRSGLEGNEFCVWAVSDPLSIDTAHAALKRGVPNYAQYRKAGHIEIVDGRNWYLTRDLKKVTASWHQTLDVALSRRFSGMRASGNAFWLEAQYHDDFLAYEQELDASIMGRPMLIMCTYPLLASRGADIIDVAHAHRLTAARRKGKWEFIEAAGKPTGHSLTLREVETLTWVARGKSAWEIGKILGITKRTVDEHVRSAGQKLGAANRTEASVIALRRHIIDLETIPGHARRR
jgi:DNA-binding CsgD family transcriptional regulator